jgi:RNA polymerase sigma-70 factor (ECF subfamily)
MLHFAFWSCPDSADCIIKTGEAGAIFRELIPRLAYTVNGGRAQFQRATGLSIARMSPTEIHSDEELLALAAAGELGAFEALYERRQGGIYRFALRMCGSESIAEDVTQDVFIALIKDAGQFDRARGTVASYLYGMARNRVWFLSRSRLPAMMRTRSTSGSS